MSLPTDQPPEISIVTPSFRSAPWLKLCIASVADQEGVRLEHIVQDSCSDDGTQDWLPQDTRVQSFIEKDRGMYDAVNRGLRRARGEVCAYLNCDEQYLPGALAKVVAAFRNDPQLEVLFSDVLLTDSTLKPISYRKAILPHELHVRFVHLNTLSCGMFFRRSIIDRGHLFDQDRSDIGDAIWVHTLLREKRKMAVINEPLAVFTFTGQNMSATPKAKAEAQRWRGAKWKNSFRPFLSAIHRVRKWRAGAYQPRHVEAALYAPADPAQRTIFREQNVGYRWPS